MEGRRSSSVNNAVSEIINKLNSIRASKGNTSLGSKDITSPKSESTDNTVIDFGTEIKNDDDTTLGNIDQYPDNSKGLNGLDKWNESKEQTYDYMTNMGDNGTPLIFADQANRVAADEAQGKEASKNAQNTINSMVDQRDGNTLPTKAQEAQDREQAYWDATDNWLVNEMPSYKNIYQFMESATPEEIANYVTAPDITDHYGNMTYDDAINWVNEERAKNRSFFDAVNDYNNIDMVGVGDMNIDRYRDYLLSNFDPNSNETLFNIVETMPEEVQMEVLDDVMNYDLLMNQLQYLDKNLGVSGEDAYNYFTVDDLNRLARMDNMKFGDIRSDGNLNTFEGAGKTGYADATPTLSMNAYDMYGVPEVHLPDILNEVYGGSLGFSSKNDDQNYKNIMYSKANELRSNKE